MKSFVHICRYMQINVCKYWKSRLEWSHLQTFVHTCRYMQAKNDNLGKNEGAQTHLYELVDICMQELELKARMESLAHTCMYLQIYACKNWLFRPE